VRGQSCLSAFLFPFGAPVAAPPCIRHRPFGIAGDWHPMPVLVRAPHRRLRCVGDLLCMGLILLFRSIPTPRGLDHPGHCLTSSMHMDVFHGDLLLAFPVSIERFEQRRCGRAYLPGSDFPADLRKSQAVSGLSLIAMTFTGSPAVVWYRSSYFVPRGSPNGEAAPVREDRPNGQENIGDLRRARDLSLFAGENFAKRKQLEAAPINCVPASVPVDQLGALTVIPLPGGRAEGW
jgi:hypothetical protein